MGPIDQLISISNFPLLFPFSWKTPTLRSYFIINFYQICKSHFRKIFQTPISAPSRYFPLKYLRFDKIFHFLNHLIPLRFFFLIQFIVISFSFVILQETSNKSRNYDNNFFIN
jgi:hypothetical protein